MPPRYPKSVACVFGHTNPCACARLIDSFFPWIEECVSLLMGCLFYLISLAYKYLPPLVEMVSNKPLPLG